MVGASKCPTFLIATVKTMKNPQTIIITNDTLEIGVKLIGFFFLLVFGILTVKLTAWFLVGVLSSIPLLFASAGYYLDKEKKALVNYFKVYGLERLKENKFDASFTVHLLEGTFLRPIFQRFAMNEVEPRVKIYKILIESSSANVHVELPFSEDKEEIENQAYEMSQVLNLKLIKYGR